MTAQQYRRAGGLAAAALALGLVWAVAATGLLKGQEATFTMTLALLALLLVIGLVDAASQRIPDPLAGLVGLASSGVAALRGVEALGIGILTAVVAASLLLGLRSLYRRLRGHQGLGLGDVKLVAALAPAIGPMGLPPVMAAACLGALGWAAATRTGPDRRLAFGPFICLAAGAWLIWGRPVARWLGGS